MDAVASFTDLNNVYKALPGEEDAKQTNVPLHQLDGQQQQQQKFFPACFEPVLQLPDGTSIKTSLQIVGESIPSGSPQHAVAYLTICEITLKKTLEGVVDDSKTESIRNFLILMRLALSECSTGLVAKKGLEILEIIDSLFDSKYFEAFGVETGDLVVDILVRIRAADWSQPLVQRCIQKIVSSSIYCGAKVRKHMIHLLGRLYGGERGIVAIPTSSSSTVATLNDVLNSSHDSHIYRALQLVQVVLPFFLRKDIMQLLQRLFLFESNDSILWQLNYAVISSVFRIDYERTKQQDSQEKQSSWIGQRRLTDSDILEILNHLLQQGNFSSQKMSLAVLLGYVWSLSFGIGCLQIVPNISLVCSVTERLLDSLEASIWLDSHSSAPYRVAQVIIRFIVMLGQKFPFVLTANRICALFCQLTTMRFSSVFTYACEILSQLLATLIAQSNNSADDKESESIYQILDHLLSVRTNLQHQKEESDLHTSSRQQQQQLLESTVFGSCLKHGGAKYLLHRIPLGFQSAEDILQNMWVLDILCKYTRQSSLQLFHTHILPLYKMFAEKVYQATQQGLQVEAKNWRMYQLSVWSAFASFCREPVDIDQGLVQLREPIMEVFKGKDSDGQMEIVRGFRNLCESACAMQIQSPVLSNAMKEILAVLFRLSFECPAEKRNLVIETVTLGAKVCSSSPNVIAVYLRKIMKRLLDAVAVQENSTVANGIANQRGIWLQLAIALMESHVLAFDTPEIQLLLKALLSNLAESHDGSLQKKSYRALLDLLKTDNNNSTSSSSNPFYAPILQQVTGAQNMWDLVQKLIMAQNSVTAGARAWRVEAMSFCMKKLSVEQFKQVLPQVLVEWILTTRDPSAKARNAAFRAILDAVARYRMSCSVENADDLAEQEQLGLQQVFHKIIAGLAGKSTTMLAATMDTVGRILFEYRGEIVVNPSLKQIILQLFLLSEESATCLNELAPNNNQSYPGPITLLLQHPSHEVVRAALNLIKVTVTVLRDEQDILVVARTIMQRLLDVSSDSKEDLRRKVKVILERLLRRCDMKKLECLVPKQHEPLFHHVRKTWERSKRMKKRQIKEPSTWDEAMEEEHEEEDDIHSVEEDGASSMRRKRHVEEEPLDILGTVSSHKGPSHIVTRKNSRRGEKETVQYTETGRIIIKEEEEEEDKARWNALGAKRSDSTLSRSNTSNSGRKRGGVGGRREMGDKHKRHKKSELVETGAKFQSSKAAGDVQRPGMPQPFAYIPLSYSHGKAVGKLKKKNAARRQKNRNK
ncbi:hypothetical protein GAYE_SCF28MG4753 [Galdieria yellowstonensis]|uniref:RRP12 HEAT domain-containing protein n=1 Tax=Galdieria yellowstonensis TaxID=3028027 RepID=A0AAV9IHJ7_9RHOD|nr:hypothetical protein GAYE_SCF28MG4753 [Galdieria yellowstonensis]